MTPHVLILALLAFALAQNTDCPAASVSETVAPPVLGNPIATLVSNDFTVNWDWGLTLTRDQTPSYKFGSCPAVEGDTTTETFTNGDCTLAQSATVDWATLPEDCGWTNVLNAGIRTVAGSMFLTAEETFTTDRGTETRTLTYEFALSVNFPEETEISSQITAFAPINTDYFVLSQTYNRPTNEGVVNFRTQVQYPWKIELLGPVGVSATPVGTNTATTSVGTETAATAPGEIFTQNWVLTIVPGTVPPVCTLDGTYTVPSRVVCIAANQSNCPALSTVPEFDIILTVISEDFCATTGLNIPLVGTLDVFSDAGLNNRQLNFELGAPSYYRLLVTSPAGTIANIDIEQVTLSTTDAAILTSGGPTDTLNVYSSNTWVAELADPALGSAVANGGTQTFAFTLTDSSVAIEADQDRELVVTARAVVTFQGNADTKKRTTLATFQVSSQRKAYATTITVSQSGAASFTPSFLMVVCLLFSLVRFY